jgi:hypothetical protein
MATAAPTDTTAATAAPAATTAAPVEPTAAATQAAVPPAAVAQVPAEEDYEQKATTSITAANASAQLTALEKEIGQ